jgi:ribosomal protein L4
MENTQPKTPKMKSKSLNKSEKKLTAAKAIVTKADKGNSLIKLRENEYSNRVQNFITNNNFTLVPHDITKKLRRKVRRAINECTDIILKETRWKHISLNPSTPKIRGLIKIHKEDSPIRPIVNWRNVPAYKLARTLVKKIQTHIPLLYTFNIKNTTHLTNDL